MHTGDERRSLQQEVAAGQSATTPVIALDAVIVVIGALGAFALTLAVIAYVLG